MMDAGQIRDSAAYKYVARRMKDRIRDLLERVDANNHAKVAELQGQLRGLEKFDKLLEKLHKHGVDPRSVKAPDAEEIRIMDTHLY